MRVGEFLKSRNIQPIDLKKETEFKNNYIISILLSLLETSKLTKMQFDFCVYELINKKPDL